MEIKNNTILNSFLKLLLKRQINYKKVIFFIAIILCFTPFINPPEALLLGLFIALFIGHPFIHLNQKATSLFLQYSVIGLGFGMNIGSAINEGKEGFLFTIFSIIGTLSIGLLITKFLKIDKKMGYLISVGTAICGGSAIAAVSPVIKAEENQVSVALGTVFILNSVALFLFPFIGHKFNLSQTQFGLWSAIAIHDTSSVVGAASKYGAKALEIATTVKLARALWIIPVAFLSSLLFKNKKSKLKIPYFIGFFFLAMLINTYIPLVQQNNHYIVTLAKSGLTITLFLIGSGLSKSSLRQVGIRPLILGISIWILISTISLFTVLHFS